MLLVVIVAIKMALANFKLALQCSVGGERGKGEGGVGSFVVATFPEQSFRSCSTFFNKLPAHYKFAWPGVAVSVAVTVDGAASHSESPDMHRHAHTHTHTYI